MEFSIEYCAMIIMKSRKRETVEGIEIPIQERIRMLGDKENYKSNTEEQENLAKPSYAAEI